MANAMRPKRNRPAQADTPQPSGSTVTPAGADTPASLWLTVVLFGFFSLSTFTAQHERATITRDMSHTYLIISHWTFAQKLLCPPQDTPFSSVVVVCNCR